MKLFEKYDFGFWILKVARNAGGVFLVSQDFSDKVLYFIGVYRRGSGYIIGRHGHATVATLPAVKPQSEIDCS